MPEPTNEFIRRFAYLGNTVCRYGMTEGDAKDFIKLLLANGFILEHKAISAMK